MTWLEYWLLHLTLAAARRAWAVASVDAYRDLDLHADNAARQIAIHHHAIQAEMRGRGVQ